MKRIIIETTVLEDEIWKLIFRIADRCNHKGIFTKDDYAALENNAKICCHDADRQEDTICAYGNRLTFDKFCMEVEKGTEFILSIVYVKRDESADFGLAMPYFVWLEQNQGKDAEITFGIDVTNLCNWEEYIYKFGQILNLISLPKAVMGMRSCYYINWTENKYQRKTAYNFPNKTNSSSKRGTPSSRRFLAILKIDPEILSLFSWNQEYHSQQQLSETFKWVENSLKGLDGRLNHVGPLKKDNFNSKFEEWFIKAYIYSCFDTVQTQKMIDEKAYQSMKVNLHEYYINIYELVQNIIFHTEGRKGLMFILFNKKKNLSPLLSRKLPDFENYDDDDRFVEINIYDYGKTGIVEQYGNTKLTLKAFFDPYDILPDTENESVEYLSLRHAAHLGIKTFVSSVMRHKGYFCAESNAVDGKKERIENQGTTLSYEMGVANIAGTSYRVVLPVKGSGWVYSSEPVQPASIVGILEKQLTRPLIPIVKAHNILYEQQIVVNGKEEQKAWVVRTGTAIIDKCLELLGEDCNEQGGCRDICIDMKGCDYITSNLFFKLIAYIQLSRLQFEKVIFIGLSPDIVSSSSNIVENLCNTVTAKHQPVWSNDHAIILVDTYLKTRVFCGETANDISYINMGLRNFYIDIENNLRLIGNGGSLSTTEERLNRFVMPYDCLAVEPCGNAFTDYVDKILGTPIDQDSIGCLVDMPTKIGSKLYIDHFYEADFLFQNSFFTDRFAFYSARDILSGINQSDNKLIIVGYNYYSEVLVSRIKYYLNSCRKEWVSQVMIAIPDPDTNDMMFKSETCPIKGLNYDVVIVVPIGSTLSTIDKIMSRFRQKFDIIPQSQYNYCSILIRDDIIGKSDEVQKNSGCTNMEKDWEWLCVQENTVFTNFSNVQEVHYFIEKISEWHNLIDKYTFPPTDETAEISDKQKNYWNERYVNQTRNSALNIRDYIKFPVAAIPVDGGKDYYESQKAIMKELSDYIYFGHIIHNHDHHRYYFNINKYITDFEAKKDADKRETRLYKWLYEDLQKEASYLCDSQYIHVIITPDPDSDPHVANLINRYLFNNNAYILYLDIWDYHENIIAKQSFFKRLVSNANYGKENYRVRFHFVDQALVTGESYLKTKSYVSAILGNPNFKFNDIITLINRLSEDRYNEILNGLELEGKSGVFSFAHFFIFPSKMPNTQCSLCRLKDYFGELKGHSVIKDCRDVIEVNKSKYEEQRYTQFLEGSTEGRKIHSVSERLRYWKRMEWRNRLFYEISLLCRNSSKYNNEKMYGFNFEVERRLSDLYNDCNDIDDKIPFLKAISFPPLSEYVKIREFSFKLMLHELRDVLSKDPPKIYDLFLLKVLLKQLAMLGSNALVRKEVIEGACCLFGKVYDQLPEEVVEIRRAINAKQDELKRCSERIGAIRKELSRRPTLTLFSEKKDEDFQREQYYISLQNEQNIVTENLKSLPKIISSLEEKLKYIYEYTSLSDTIIDEQEIKETIAGDNKLNRFLFDLHFYIKMATHHDEAKSLWLGEMLRRGREMEIESYGKDYKAQKTRLYNRMFKENGDTTGFRHVLSPLLFYDNTAIIRKTLDNFDNESKRDVVLQELLYDQQGMVSFKDLDINMSRIVDRYNEIIEQNYYYIWFRHYLTHKNGSLSEMSNDNVPLIRKHVEVLHARKLLQNLLNPSIATDNSFDKNAEIILEAFARIMDARSAFVVIKPEGGDHLYTLATYSFPASDPKYDMFYCRKLLFEEDDLQKGRPFVMRKNISNYGESFNNKYNRAAYLSLNKTKVDKKSGKSIDVLVGMVVFLFDEDESNIRFMIEKQELGRLLLLLKPETDAYVRHVSDEKLFEVWVTQRHLAKLTSATNHGLSLSGWDFDNLSTDDYKSIYNGIVMLSDVTIRHMYANLINHHGIQMGSNMINLSKLFDEKYQSLLMEIVKQKFPLITLTIGTPPDDVYIKGLETVFRSYFIQLIFNASLHADSQNIQITFNDKCVEVRNDILKEEDDIKVLQEIFHKKYNREAMKKFVDSPNYIDYYGFTLLTLYFYCESVGMDCEMDIDVSSDDPFFYIKLFYPQNK